MFGIRFAKYGPTTSVIHFKQGKVHREGAGLSFFYYAPTSSIVTVPLSSVDLPFVFNVTTADFQAATIQGQLTYRVAEPGKLAQLLDLSADHGSGKVTEAQEKLGQRLVNEAQTATNAFALGLALREVLRSPQRIAATIMSGLSASPGVSALGVEPIGVAVLSVQPTPEMARALEAEAREALQQEADRAIYERRNLAVEQERRIKENELSTEIAVELKRRTIRETQMAADIAVEEQRATLLERKCENDRLEAQARGDALEAVLRPLGSVDWHTLLAVGSSGLDAAGLISLAVQELAQKAEKIGTLNLSPELLSALLAKSGKR